MAKIGKRKGVGNVKAQSPEQRQDILAGEELDRWNAGQPSLFVEDDPKNEIEKVAAESISKILRRHALGVPEHVDIENAKEDGAHKDAIAQYRPKLLQGLRRSIAAAQRLESTLLELQSLEGERPENRPPTALLAATLRGETPSSVMSVLGQKIGLMVRMNSAGLASLLTWQKDMKTGRGRRRSETLRSVENSLRDAGLGDKRIGNVLLSEGLEGAAGDSQQRVRDRRRRGGVKTRQK